MGKTITLLDGMFDEQDEPTESTNGFVVRSRLLAPDPVKQAIVRAIIQNHSRPDVDLIEANNTRATIAIEGTNAFGASGANAREVTLFRAPDGRLAFKDKGARNKAFYLNQDALLDLEPGFGQVDVLRTRLAATRVTLPQLEPLTREHLLALPTDAVNDEGHTSDCTLAIFGTWTLGDGSECADAVWFCCGYDPEDDIVDNVLIVRPEVGFSEHGSDYGQNFLRRSCGVVVGFKPITFKAALDLTDANHDDVLATLRAPATV